MYVKLLRKPIIPLIDDNTRFIHFTDIHKHLDDGPYISSVTGKVIQCGDEYKPKSKNTKMGIPTKLIDSPDYEDICERAILSDIKLPAYMVNTQIVHLLINIQHLLIPFLTIDKEICKIILKRRPLEFRYIPIELIDSELCSLAMVESSNLKYIPNHLKNYDMCFDAVHDIGRNLQYVPDNLMTYELCKLSVQNKSRPSLYTPRGGNDEFYLLAFDCNKYIRQSKSKTHTSKKHGLLLKYSSRAPIEIQRISIYDESYIEIDIPDFEIDRPYNEICSLGDIYYHNLEFVPEKFITFEICKMAIEISEHAIRVVPNTVQNYYKLCKLAVRKNGDTIKYIPIENLNRKLCKIAVKSNGNNIRYIPNKYRTKKLMKYVSKDLNIELT